MISLFRKRIASFWNGVVYYAKGLYKRFSDENILFLASGVAFNGILCLIPILLLLTSLIGIFIHQSIFPLQKIDDVLNAIFPPQPYAQDIKTSIIGIIRDIEEYRSTFGYTGIVILIWASASMFSSIRIVLNRIYHLKPRKLVILTYIENLLFVIVLGAMFIAANIFSWFFVLIESFLRAIPEIGPIDLTIFSEVISVVISLLIAFVIFYGINRFVPGERIPRKVAAIAAITTTSLWWIAGKAFAWYLAAFHPYSKLYGTYAVVLVFFLWIYYSSAVFVAGVVVGQLYRERRSQILP